MPARNPWSPAPNSPGLKIKWSDGWIEDFPEDEFAEECSGRPARIRMYKPGEDAVVIEYALTVEGTRADLNYGGKLAVRNRRPERDIYIGVTRLTFTDANRTTVRSVAWKDEGDTTFEVYDPLVSWSATAKPVGGPFTPPTGDRRQRRELSSALRPGQMRFRAQLLGIYGRCCAVSRCAIEGALEAAHIMPYLGPAYDHPQNGILMRADLHRLFDARLWSIDPWTMRVRLSAEMHAIPNYASFEGSSVRVPRARAMQPSRIALQDHWAKFSSRR